ncbi:MAG: hypothetical protein KDE27_09155 [Planctomycetes bacterium]|nr:hypothetical protein [Planctomycetota bacterium]
MSIDTSRLRVLDPLPARLPAEEASCNAADDERRGPPPRLDDPDEEATTAIGDGTAWPLIQSRAASAPYPAEPFVSAHWVVIAPPRAPPAAADQDCSRHPDAA